MAGHGGGSKAVIAALFANGGIAIAKFVAFLLTGATSMLAESIHSVADTGNQALLLLGMKRGKKVATEEHPFGYGRERFFWSFVVALVLFSLGSLYSIYEGVQKLMHPHEISSLGIAIGVLVIAIVLEGFSLRTAVVESDAAKGDASWVEFIRHSKSPELPVVLLEDIGAMFGLVFALTGITAAALTGDPVYDAIGTIAIGTLLGIIAIVLVIEMKSLLIGESATTKDQAAILAAIENGPEVRRVIYFKTQHIGPEEVLVAAKVDFMAAETDDLAAAIDIVEQRVRAAVPMARQIFLEPDLFRTQS